MRSPNAASALPRRGLRGYPAQVPETKDEIRRRMRSLLPLPPDQRAEKSARICERIAAMPEWKAARTVAIFAPQPCEPDIEGLWPSAAGKTVACPRVEGAALALYSAASLYDLRPAYRGIREPDPDPARLILPEAVDFIVVPGVAFCADGTRLGRGGGYYDRLLATLPAATRRVGVCFTMQLLGELPATPHDMRVDAVIAE